MRTRLAAALVVAALCISVDASRVLQQSKKSSPPAPAAAPAPAPAPAPVVQQQKAPTPVDEPVSGAC